ncbi:MAG: histidine phosphatase family protein [Vulcanibacillus sp.]
METTIYLIRHAETDSNRERRYQGHKDVPLNSFGDLQAIKLAQRFYDETIRIDAIYSSDLQRAKQTAYKVAEKYNLEVNIDIDLRERSFGKLEGLKTEDVESLYADFDILKCNEPNIYDIEPYDSLKSRAYKSIYELSRRHVDNNIVIVSHGSTINSFLREIDNMGIIEEGFRLINTSISTVIFNHQELEWKIIEVNDVAHIESREKS